MMNLRIGQRFGLGFIAALLLTAVLGVISLSRVSDLRAGMQEMKEIKSVKQRHAINFRGSVHDRAISLPDVYLVSSEAELNAAVTEIERLARFYADAAGPLDTIMESAASTTDEERAILKSIKETEARTLPMIEEVVRLQRAGQTAQAHVIKSAPRRLPSGRRWR